MRLQAVVCFGFAVLILCGNVLGEVETSQRKISPLERAFMGAPVVLSGTVANLTETGLCTLKVDEVLKSSNAAVPLGSSVSIDVSVAPAGLWPPLNGRIYAAVSGDEKAGFKLYSRFGSMTAADGEAALTVRRLLGVPDKVAAVHLPVVPPQKETGVIGPETPVKPAVVHVSDSIESQVLAAELIAVGRVVEVGFSRETDERAVLRFIIDSRILGGGVPDLVEVHVPSPDADFAGELPSLRLGRYCLFLRSRRVGGGLNLISPYFGVYFLEDAAQEALLKEKIFSTSVMREKRGQAPILTTIQATIGVWQDAWNGKNLARLIACYARGSDFRKLYDAGGKYRLALDRKLREFPGTVSLNVLGMTGDGPDKTAVSVEMLLDVEGSRERRNAEMTLVREDGEWRILVEGF